MLLTRCLDDVDDEVRDRAALNLRLMDQDDELAVNFIRNGMYSKFYNIRISNNEDRLNVLTTRT